MKEMYALKTLDGFKIFTVEEANKKYEEAEFPRHEDLDDDLCSALECETCGCIYEYDPNYTDCPCCDGDSRKVDTDDGLYLYRDPDYDKWIRGQIAQVADGQTDFSAEFDKLFNFMAANPDSETTSDFAYYHQADCNDPKILSGEADFGYLIGKDFVLTEWVAEKDVPEFIK